MFFILIAMILLTGMLLAYYIVHGMTMEGVIAGLFLVFLVVYTIHYYRQRKKKKRDENEDWLWMDCFYFDCPAPPGFFKNLDCDGGDCDCGGFDCSP